MQYYHFVYCIIFLLFLFLGSYTIRMFFYKYYNDFVKSSENMQSNMYSPSSSPTSIMKKQIKQKKNVSWNPVVSIGDTYSKEEYDRRLAVVQITQNIALARIEKSLEFEFGFDE